MLFIIHRKQKSLAKQNDTTRRRLRRKRRGKRSGEESLGKTKRKMDKKIKRIKGHLRFLKSQYKIILEMLEDCLNNNIL